MPPLSAAKTKNDPCQTCRDRHLRCDEARPICGRCKRSGDECLRAVSKLRFRHGSSARYDSDFADDQIWLSTSGNGTLEYIDETQELANYYARDTDQDVPPGLEHRSGSFGSSVDAATSARPYGTPSSRPEPSPSIQSQSSKVTVEPETWPLKRRRTNTWTSPSPHFNVYAHGSPNGQSSILLHSPTYSYHGSVTQSSSDAAYDSLLDSAKLSDGREEYQSGRHAPVNFELAPRSFPLSDQPFWPHIDVQEACLIRYFVEDLASWFDLCDPGRHFALVVPQRAATCPPLLNAIFTASARHLSRLQESRHHGAIEYHQKYLPDLRIETAVQYHNRCINHLVSLSDDPEEVLDENLLAAAIILRFYEEVDAPLCGTDNETGLRGIQLFIDAQAVSAVSSRGLRHAAFRVGFRQEVYMAFIKQRPFRLPLTLSDGYRSFEPADDHTWAHRAVVHCADALMYCYGEAKHTNEEYAALLQSNQRWHETRPHSFEPFHNRPPDVGKGEFFPELWYLSECHVTGVQHMDLATILLTVYNPRLPRLGPGSRVAARNMQDSVKSTVRRLCGIALSNRRAPPAMNTACIAIAMCGDHFAERSEQQALLEILVETDEKHAWPTGEIQKALKEGWGWEDLR